MRTPRASRPMEWVRISPARRLGYGLLAALLLSIFAGMAWLALTYGRGLLETAILGATLAGGASALFHAITGKEQHKKAA
ncbi:MAG: hypothetical protein ACT4OI_08765 [Methanobacteriota archaeon]